jgi:hypothetical protein
VGVHVEHGERAERTGQGERGGSSGGGSEGGGSGGDEDEDQTPRVIGAPRLVVEPLLEEGQLEWFCASSLLVYGREVAVTYERDGWRCGKAGVAGLALWLDGRLVAHAPSLRRLSVPL